MTALTLGKINIARHSFKQALLECIRERRPWAICSVYHGNIVKHKEVR